MRRKQVLSKLEQTQAQILKECGIRILGLVGSVGRGDSGPDSDVDIVYERGPNKPVTLLDVSHAKRLLSIYLKSDVDLVDWDAVKPHYRRTMREDLLLLHG